MHFAVWQMMQSIMLKHTEKVQNLDQLSKDLSGFKNNNIPDNPVWRALEDVNNKYNISFDMMFKQLDTARRWILILNSLKHL